MNFLEKTKKSLNLVRIYENAVSRLRIVPQHFFKVSIKKFGLAVCFLPRKCERG